MKLYDNKGNSYNASKVRRPKMKSSMHRGRSWDSEFRTLDGKQWELWLDTTWGTAFYFAVDGQWYRLPFYTSPRWASKTDAYKVADFFTIAPASRTDARSSTESILA